MNQALEVSRDAKALRSGALRSEDSALRLIETRRTITMDIRQHNRRAWNVNAAAGCCWSIPVDRETIAAARRGHWDLYLTPARPAPPEWIGDVAGRKILCLAGGGGQQGPVLAAAGADVTVFDQSPLQLSRDRDVARREGLRLHLAEGSMDDLSRYPDDSFDAVVHPVSNCYVPDVHPVWREAARVLRPGGSLLAGFINPVSYVFDPDKAARGVFQVRYKLPYSDVDDLSPQERQQFIDECEAFQFGHLLEDQIGGQLAAGLVIVGFFEDRQLDAPWAEYLPTVIATHARKPPLA
jgi:SAM-dependent methyltransferase